MKHFLKRPAIVVETARVRKVGKTMDQNRVQLVVYAKKFNQLQKLSHYGHVIYLSRKMNYGCLYVSIDQKDKIVSKIKNLYGVSRVDVNPMVLEAIR